MHPEQLAKSHYENFPVGSLFLSKRHREVIHLVYAFARIADDIADEGSLSSAERILELDQWESLLLRGVNNQNEDPFFMKLSDALHRYSIPAHLLLELLVAFRRDANNPVYRSYSEILDYCRYSANPIGRIMLRIFNSSDETTEPLSDHICTALQLTNFLQDISIDTGKNRFYIAIEELEEFGLALSDLSGTDKSKDFKHLVKYQVERIRILFHKGKPLIDLVQKDFRFEMKLIWHGGMRILEKIEALDYDTRKIRPTLTKIDAVKIALRALH